MGIKEEVKRLVDTESADPYVTNRLAPVDRRALLEEPEVVEAAGGSQVLERMRAELEALASR
jgi:hypothetical protein